MTVKELAESNYFETVQLAENAAERTITGAYCCDLLSFAMGRAPEGCAWATVMGNINTLAVAALADVACIILAEGSRLDAAAAAKLSTQKELTVFMTKLPVFEAALAVHEKLA